MPVCKLYRIKVRQAFGMISKNILLYSPNLIGHPQVYCRVIGDILLERKVQLVIATENTDNWAVQWPDLRPFASRSDVHVVSTTTYSKEGSPCLLAEELRQLQIDYRIDSTLFVEADSFRDEFVKVGAGQTKPLIGLNAGIFNRTVGWYPQEEFYSGRRIHPLEGTLRQNLGKIKRRIFNPHTFDSYFFEKVLIRRKVLDYILVKDERITGKYGSPVLWLPDMYKVFNAVDDSEGEEEWLRDGPAFKKFATHGDTDDLLLFFGAGAWYKGYDYFIQLLARDPSAIGVHAGAGIRYEKGKPFVGNPESKRKELLKRGRLFETGGYVRSQQFIDLLFSCSHSFVSTHRLTASSGTILQALDKGLPVLVPDSGLVGYCTRKFGLGRTYRYGDIDDLVDKWLSFKKEPVEQYLPAIKKFMGRFDRSALEELFVGVLLDQANN